MNSVSDRELADVLVKEGIKRSFLPSRIILEMGHSVILDVLVVNHRKYFPNMKYVVLTAVGSVDLRPVGFRDLSINHVSVSQTRCFGSNGECIPQHICKDWHNFDRGVPYRDFRLSLNTNHGGFMILESFLGSGLDKRLQEIGDRLALEINPKRELLPNQSSGLSV